MNPILTIAITTYNRKAQLLRQLNSIYSQPECRDVSVLIIDNHSNYDVEDFVRESFDKALLQNTSFVINPKNLGMNTNLCLPFFYCKTEWMWTLSDDDETVSGSIGVVLNNIVVYPNVSVFKYQVKGFKDYCNQDFETLPDLIDFYYNGYHTGHLVFLSNCVYNLKKLKDFDNDIITNCFCAIPQVLPIFNILDNRQGIVRYVNTVLVNYMPPKRNKGWNYLKTAVQFSIVPFFDYKLSTKYYKRFGFVIMSNFSHFRIIISALELKSKKRGKFLYKQIYNRSFRYSGQLIDKIYYILFFIMYYTRIRISYDMALNFRSFIRKYIPNFR